MSKEFYSLGFAFNQDKTKLVLIKKTKPLWQNGLLNGVGGKVEPGELYINTMVREFEEETSVKTEDYQWHQFAVMESDNLQMPCYTAILSEIQMKAIKTTTEEEIVIIDPNVIIVGIAKSVPNLKWLIPLALDFYREKKFTRVSYETP